MARTTRAFLRLHLAHAFGAGAAKTLATWRSRGGSGGLKTKMPRGTVASG